MRSVEKISAPSRRSLARQLGKPLVLVCAGAMLYYYVGFFIPRVLDVRAAKGLGGGYSFGADFYPVWLTSRECLLRRCNLYSTEMTSKIQTGLFGRPLDMGKPNDPPIRYREFAYPAFVDLLFWPANLLQFPAVRMILAFLLPITTAGTVLLWLKALQYEPPLVEKAMFVLLTLCSYQVLEGVFAEQLGLVVGFLLAAAVAALMAEKYRTAGIALAMTTIKPQMVVLVILCVLLWSVTRWRERRGVLFAFAVAESLLCGAAFYVWPDWLRNWIGILFDYRNYSTPPLVTDVFGPRLGPVLGPLLGVALTFTAIRAMWLARHEAAKSIQFLMTVSLALAVTAVAFLPGQAVHDHIVLLPGIVLLVRFWRSIASAGRVLRWMSLLSMAALFWQWVAALLVVIVRPFISAQRFYSPAIFVLPLRLALPFAFALLGVLLLVMRSLEKGALNLSNEV
ncbi:MAG TPA: glycosyltransferase 87 family protein [Candidatus Binatia bacterium]|nr:glycosyltransferase 87 family protein [Candidatus Binatia bacterium]